MRQVPGLPLLPPTPSQARVLPPSVCLPKRSQTGGETRFASPLSALFDGLGFTGGYAPAIAQSPRENGLLHGRCRDRRVSSPVARRFGRATSGGGAEAL